MWFLWQFVIQTDTKMGVLLYNIQWSIGHLKHKQAFIVVGKLYNVTFDNIKFHQPAVKLVEKHKKQTKKKSQPASLNISKLN